MPTSTTQTKPFTSTLYGRALLAFVSYFIFRLSWVLMDLNESDKSTGEKTLDTIPIATYVVLADSLIKTLESLLRNKCRITQEDLLNLLSSGIQTLISFTLWTPSYEGIDDLFPQVTGTAKYFIESMASGLAATITSFIVKRLYDGVAGKCTAEDKTESSWLEDLKNSTIGGITFFGASMMNALLDRLKGTFAEIIDALILGGVVGIERFGLEAISTYCAKRAIRDDGAADDASLLRAPLLTAAEQAEMKDDDNRSMIVASELTDRAATRSDSRECLPSSDSNSPLSHSSSPAPIGFFAPAAGPIRPAFITADSRLPEDPLLDAAEKGLSTACV